MALPGRHIESTMDQEYYYILHERLIVYLILTPFKHKKGSVFSIWR
jgi:hypothetical protein